MSFVVPMHETILKLGDEELIDISQRSISHKNPPRIGA